ncbi:MAG: 6-carboxytetrahydropterin synthase QueD [Candidatus Ratteibacteria bacterium]|nr:6-carboxytetrahydropterin synthase QueD [Candidatus Ratteibacteria bacterium]
MYEIWVKTDFAGAHHLRNYEGKCESVHGHNWTVEIYITCKNLNRIGLGMDFVEVKKKLAEVIEKLDHKDLNNLSFFKKKNPSAENIACFIYKELEKKINSPGIKLSKVFVKESENSGVSYFEK